MSNMPLRSRYQSLEKSLKISEGVLTAKKKELYNAETQNAPPSSEYNDNLLK